MVYHVQINAVNKYEMSPENKECRAIFLFSLLYVQNKARLHLKQKKDFFLNIICDKIER